MKKRTFLAAMAAVTMIPAVAFAGSDTVYYKPGVLEKHLAAGETVFVDYKADWCSTCRRQERVISDIRASNPAYNENIVFIVVDWDRYTGSPITRDYNIPRRSTLLLLRGDEELGRIVAGTSVSQIRDLLDLGL